MLLAAQTRHEADAGELERTVFIFGQILLHDAVESPLADRGVARREEPETHALKDRVGDERGSGGLEVVARRFRLVRHLVEHALLALERRERVREVLHQADEEALLVVEGLVGRLRGLDQREGEPAERAQPEVRAAAGDRVRPVHLTALVVAVIVEAGDRVLHVGFYIFKLVNDVLALLHLREAGLVAHVERLRHVEAVQPDLVRVDVLVPEAAFLRARHRVELGADKVERLPVLFIAGLVVEKEQVRRGVDVVEVVLLDVVGPDRPVLPDKEIDELLRKIKILLLARDLVEGEDGGDHAAVDVVPLVLLALADHLLVPHGLLSAGICQQIRDILFDLCFCFLCHALLSSPSYLLNSPLYIMARKNPGTVKPIRSRIGIEPQP